MLTIKVLPFLISLYTVMVPLSNVTRPCTIANPSHAGIPLGMRLINWVKGLGRSDRAGLFRIPMPVSVTSIINELPPGWRRRQLCSVMLPLSVYLLGVGQQVDDNLPDAQRIGVHQQVAAFHFTA